MNLPTPIYQQLIDAIEKGGLRPGDRMLETELASRFGVSRTPVSYTHLTLPTIYAV